MIRWITTHWKALRRFPDEEGIGYQDRIAFEKGAWDGRHWDDSRDENDPGEADVLPKNWEDWRHGFAVTKDDIRLTPADRLGKVLPPLLFDRLVSWLLWKGNAHPEYKEVFYDLKDQILQQHGELLPDVDVQEIIKTCWSCDGTGWYDVNEEECWKCDGSGVYEHRFIELRRWRFGRHLFHQPGRTSWSADYFPSQRPLIRGFIRHRHVSPHASREAQLWLYWLFLPDTFRRHMRQGWNEFTFWPLSLFRRARNMWGEGGWRILIPYCKRCYKRVFPTVNNICFACTYEKIWNDEVPF